MMWLNELLQRINEVTTIEDNPYLSIGEDSVSIYDEPCGNILLEIEL